MAGAIKLLHFQLLAYWRKSFSMRGSYDRLSLILVLIILLAGYRFVLLLNQTAKSLSEGKTGDLNLFLAITFSAWIFPTFESQKSSEKLSDFVYLPLTKNQFSLICLANVFLVPTSIIALIVSFSIIYPLAFSPNFAVSAVGLFFYSLFAVFSLTLFVRLLKLRFFRVLIFLTVIFWAIFGKEININSRFLPHNLFAQIVSGEVSNILWLIIFALTAFFLAFVAIRQTISVSAKTNRRITPNFLSKINLPIKFGEMIKKDFFASWKTFDSYIALLISIIYVIVLFSADVSIFSFSVVIFLVVMMCSSLAFNIFGLENLTSFQRLSLLPIQPKDLFIAKNKAFGLLILSQTLFLFPLILYKFGAVYLLIAILKTITITLFYMAWGNSLSVRFPFKMNFYEVSFDGSIQDMLTAVFVIGLITLAPDFFLMQNTLVILLINIALTILSYAIYQVSLRRISGKLSDEWENIAFKLS